MSKYSLPSKLLSILLLISGFFCDNSTAQQLKITDFVLFGGRGIIPVGMTVTQPLAPGFGVQIGSASKITSGALGSYTLVKTTGNVTMGGNIFSGGTINLANSNSVNGNIGAANSGLLSGTIFQMGSNASVTGNVDVFGNIIVSGGTITGRVTHPAGTTYSGPIPLGGNVIGAPSIPILPQMPNIAGFAAGGANINSTQIITPGTYGDVKLGGNKTLTLSGTGVYFFKSINNTGGNNFVFDFLGDEVNAIKIYIEGDVDLNKVNASITNGGSADRIYAEVHGTGATSSSHTVAWNIANGSAGNSSKWLGSVWAPYAAINLGSGTGSSDLSGAFWSGTQVNVQNGVNINFAPFLGSTNPDDGVIFPDYPPPPNGKSDDLIGPELISLCKNFGNGLTPSPYIYTIIDQSVLIEVIAIEGEYDNLLQRLITDYGMTDFQDNGPNTLIITGKILIANLCILNDDVTMKPLIDYCRPLFPGIVSSGVANTNGDISVHANVVRSAYDLSGDSIKVGVLSDGFNTIPGDPANTDVLNGDLPGIGNPDHPTPVKVLKEYPYGRVTDEGRAMLQHIHDLAPGALLEFRTGFVSEGDFAQGIYALQKDSCKIITDDVTFITAPFLKDGVAAKAVDYVKSQGVSYFSAAGNFGAKSYEGVFNPTAAPAGVIGFAHNFGGGDILQNDSLKPGVYTVVLQWEDSIYSLGQGGALNDFDIYLTDDAGTSLFGMNRFNIGADPLEILPFYVTANTRTNIMIIRAGGTGNVRFKLVVFRGELKFNEFESGTSTLIGQANALGAMAVGAARYTNTPAFGVTPAKIETFSSVGGTHVYGVIRNKPDFTAPDGGNTTVNFGAPNIDGDLFPNFFGTSAAAPHAAGVAALILEGKKKFFNKVLEPDSVRYLLGHTALDMATVGFDNISGYGLIQADAAVGTFAVPTPHIIQLVLPSADYIPGPSPFLLKVKGSFFQPNSVITFRGAALSTTVLNDSEATATIPAFIGNPAIQVYTPPITPSGLDGGYSNILYFFNIIKKQILVTADNKTKRFGEKLPDFTSTILVDNVPLANTNLTLTDLKLDTIKYTTPATSTSNVGIFFIRPSMKKLSAADSLIFEIYDYTFVDGLLSNNKMPLLVTPRDTTLVYGDKISGFSFIYKYDDALIPKANRGSFLAGLKSAHYATMNNDVTAFVDAKTIINGRVLTDADLLNMSVMASGKTIINARTIINAKTIINGTIVYDTTKLLDLAVESIYNYQLDSASSPLVSAKTIINARTIINAKNIINGTAYASAKNIINGSTILNSNAVGDTSNSNVVVIIDEEDVPEDINILSDFTSVNMVTGITAGHFTIVPAALISDNFEITYGLGKLTITPAPLTVKADDKLIFPGDPLPAFTSTIKDLKNGDTVLSGPSYTLDPAYTGLAGTYSIIPSDLQVESHKSYTISYIPGTLYVDPKGNNAKNIKPVLDCVDTLINDPSGFKYVAHFSYRNDNPTVVYVPRGVNNSLTGLGSHSGLQPELFQPGGGSFNILFDGLKLTWVVKTYKVYQKTSIATEASATSGRCKNYTAPQSIASSQIAAPNDRDDVKMGVFPNPSTGWVTLSVDKGLMSEKDVVILNMIGKSYAPNMVKKISNHGLQLDLSNLAAGTYLIKVKVENVYKTFRVVKL